MWLSPRRGLATPVTTYAYDATYTASADDSNGQVTRYSYDAVGDRTGDSPMSPDNPFPGGTTTNSYDAMSNTTHVTDSGSGDLSGTTTYTYDYQENLPEPTGPTTIDPGTLRYSYDTTDPNEPNIDLPTAGMSVTTYDYDAASTRYLVVEEQTKYDAANGGTYTDSIYQYQELQLQSDGDVTGRLSNNTSNNTIDLGNAHYFISDTQIPLDQLNFGATPPTDPRFTPIPGIPDGTVLGPGESVGFNTPEPTGFAISLVAAAGILRRRKRSIADC